MNGSISIKDLLPAVLHESERLQEIYSRPYSGLFIKDKVFYQTNPETGQVLSPYKLLGTPAEDLPDDEVAERVIQSDPEIISDGGAAMMAWSRLQFDDIPAEKRSRILQALYEYCELDTLAMVMIHQHWESLAD